MSAREPVSKLSAACPTTDAAGSTIRRRDIAGFSVTEALYADGVSLARHCHAESYLTLILAGAYTERYAHRERQWGQGALHLLPAGEGHENCFQTAARVLRVKIEPFVIQRLDEKHADCLSEPREITGALAGWLASRMIHEFMAQDDIAPLAMEGVLLEVLAESARCSSETQGCDAPGWLRRVRESLEDSYLRPPGLAALAAIAGVHPVHVSREFRKHYRMTIGECIRRRRMEHASELLSGSDLSMADIAAACGFFDQSHFCAIFKKHAGMSPAKFRDLSRWPRARVAKASA